MVIRFQGCAVAVLLLSTGSGAQEPAQVPINAPYVTTPDKVVTAMLKLAGVKSSDTVYDLGCGDGRIVIAAARMYKAHGVGIDINPARIEEARANARKAAVETLVKFEVGDIYTTNISNATVVTLYLLPEVNLRLRPRLQNTLKPGARVVSHTFDMGDWKPDKEQIVAGSRIFLWTVSPLRNIHFRRRHHGDVRNLGANLNRFEPAGLAADDGRDQILVVQHAAEFVQVR